MKKYWTSIYLFYCRHIKLRKLYKEQERLLKVMQGILEASVVKAPTESEMMRFILSQIIDPDGESAIGWRTTFSLIPKTTVAFLEGTLANKQEVRY